MFSLDQNIFKNNSFILSQVVFELEDIKKDINNINNEVLLRRITDIILLMNKAINENKNNYEQILKHIKEMNIKLENLSKNNNFGQILTKYYPEGTYEGEIVNNRREGKGKFYYINNSEYMGKEYDGEWKNDMREGRGIEKWPDGDRFEGHFLNDLRDGRGIYYYSDGERHEGYYKNGKKEGIGLFYYTNGDLKVCNYFNDKQIGKIILLTANGEVQVANVS